MTRVLSQLLEAREPEFRQTVDRLEKSSGQACHDIRLTEAINRLGRAKLAALGLDPDDTTGEELYLALQAKLTHDDLRLIKRLRTISASSVSAEANISDGIACAIQKEAGVKKVFALKNSVAKKLITANQPKKTMKSLGYRSVASMLKHEPVPLIVTIALCLESSSWEKQYRQQLKALSARDFEDKAVAVYCPKSLKWRAACYKIMSDLRQTVVVDKELACIVVLPLPSNQPKPGLTTATLAIGLNGLNAIQSSSSYLRLSQVASDFGQRLEATTNNEPQLGVSFLSAPLSWETVQRFFHHMAGLVEYPIEMHVDIEEIIGWQPIESVIHKIAPELEFWKETGHIGKLDERRPVSFNLLDNALCLCNHRDFSNRFYHHLQRSLWQEFILRYIRPDLLRDAINQELQPKLAPELITV